jgi:hypothetical protein
MAGLVGWPIHLRDGNGNVPNDHHYCTSVIVSSNHTYTLPSMCPRLRLLRSGAQCSLCIVSASLSGSSCQQSASRCFKMYVRISNLLTLREEVP